MEWGIAWQPFIIALAIIGYAGYLQYRQEKRRDRREQQRDERDRQMIDILDRIAGKLGVNENDNTTDHSQQ